MSELQSHAPQIHTEYRVNRNRDADNTQKARYTFRDENLLRESKSLADRNTVITIDETMNSGESNSFSSGNNDSSPREKLLGLRHALLRLHKTLLEMERREYERVNGRVSTGELFRLVIDHAQFAWLHNISEFVVRIDESLAADMQITAQDTNSAVTLARKMFVPSESGDQFQKRYYEAIQLDPAVVIEHAELVRLFANEPSDAGSV